MSFNGAVQSGKSISPPSIEQPVARAMTAAVFVQESRDAGHVEPGAESGNHASFASTSPISTATSQFSVEGITDRSSLRGPRV